MIQNKLQELDEVLRRDVSRSRGLLRDLLGEIVLRPTSEGLVAELRGNVEGLLRLEKALLDLLVILVAGAGFVSYLRSPPHSATWVG